MGARGCPCTARRRQRAQEWPDAVEGVGGQAVDLFDGLVHRAHRAGDGLFPEHGGQHRAPVLPPEKGASAPAPRSAGHGRERAANTRAASPCSARRLAKRSRMCAALSWRVASGCAGPAACPPSAPRCSSICAIRCRACARPWSSGAPTSPGGFHSILPLHGLLDRHLAHGSRLYPAAHLCPMGAPVGNPHSAW
jgi:hypothetical protein